ncbi:ATP-dependent 26S proteasome regulatory subunit [Vibrio mediterranei AK1]|uniref:3'-5' exonuclease n=1 Tax=Vibrio mediterranei TaxID=689 RepID=UPI0001542101|nr:3'-5' exonuclease [Vibrio mediterranei]EDL52594.1 ATP-dependent 26S proteasome regulatory subunit [Vibrio mediterranei AK1]
METKKTKHIMIDLETMGNSSNAAIVSIGAVVFDPETGILGADFEEVVSLNSSAFYSDIDAPTVTWWLSQNDEARAIFLKETPKSSLRDALTEFNQWLSDLGDKKELCLWGNGAGFDNVILNNAFKACRIQPNFMHWNDLDVRTIVKMGKDILGIDPKSDLPREGVHHSALDDARFQARYVSAIWGQFSSTTPIEHMRNAIQHAELQGLVRTEDGTVITGAVETNNGIVLVKE